MKADLDKFPYPFYSQSMASHHCAPVSEILSLDHNLWNMVPKHSNQTMIPQLKESLAFAKERCNPATQPWKPTKVNKGTDFV